MRFQSRRRDLKEAAHYSIVRGRKELIMTVMIYADDDVQMPKQYSVSQLQVSL